MLVHAIIVTHLFVGNQFATDIAIDKLDPFLSTYPITRPLYIYTDAKAIRKRPEVEGFVNYYLTYVNEKMYSLGYFPVKTTLAF